jgi:tetratricopeptide (TPR) repeat protein
MEHARRKSQILLICLCLALATSLAYERVRLNEFVNYDDDRYVTDNAQVRAGITPESVAWAFTTTHVGNWHPLTWLSHMLDVELYGLNPAGHHLTNVLLHIVNTLLLLGLLVHMTGRLWPSAFVAALFALHPLHVEAVVWVSERKELLSTLFGLLAMWAYVGYARRGDIGRYLLAATLLALGLMARPMLVTLPFVFLLLDYWPLKRTRFGPSDELICPKRSISHLLIEKVPLLVLSALSSIATLIAQEPGTGIAIRLGAANAVVSYVRYLGKMIWPAKLSVLYPHPDLPGGAPWTEWQVAGAVLLLLVITVLVIWTRRQRYALVGWLWYLGTLVPVIGLVQVGRQAMADRYTYLPLIGLFIIVGYGGGDLISRWSSRPIWVRRIARVSVFAVLVACVASSWSQTRHWRDSVALFEHALEVNPRNPTMHYNLGNSLKARGERAEAADHYRQALEINPRYFKAHTNLGNVLASLDLLDEAIEHYREALSIKPDLPEAHSSLASALVLQGKPAEAILHCRQALQIKPDFAEAHHILGSALRSQGRLDEAISHYLKAVRLKPDLADAYYNLGLVLGLTGNPDEAIYYCRQALAIEPDLPEAHYNLGLVLGSQGQLDEAIRHYRQALATKPNYAKAHNNLGVVLVSQGKLDEAIRHYRQAVWVEPDFADAYYNLGTLLLSQGQLAEAIAQYREALRTNPDYAAAHHNLGVALESQGMLDEAILHYRRAVQLNPSFAKAHNNRDVELKIRDGLEGTP